MYIGFAFGNDYGVLFFSRAFQGLGSACASTAGMGMLASLYRDDDERGKKLGIALGGIATGVLGEKFIYHCAGRAAKYSPLQAMSILIISHIAEL